MSEEMKPRQLWTEVFIIDYDEPMLEANSYHVKPKHWPIKPTKLHMHTIELEPTLKMMDEMAKALNAIWGHTEDCTDSEELFDEGETCECGFILVERAYKKYRKFLEGMK